MPISIYVYRVDPAEVEALQSVYVRLPEPDECNIVATQSAHEDYLELNAIALAELKN